MVKTDALLVHLKKVEAGGAILPLYVFSGDEPLLMMEAMDQLSSELHPNMKEASRNELIEDFAKRAADIAGYLQDTGFA